MRLLFGLAMALLMILGKFPETLLAPTGSGSGNNESIQVVDNDSSALESKLDSAAGEAEQNKAFANLQIIGNVAYVKAAFQHPENLPVNVRIDWKLLAWNTGSTSPEPLENGSEPAGITRVEVNIQLPLPPETYDYYLLECRNKIKNFDGAFETLFITESRWSRIAPYNGTQERTGEVTSTSAVLHTYLTEKPAFAATAGETLLVPPMAGFAKFSVYSDVALQNLVSDSGFYPVDDYIQIDTEWRRTFYNYRWTVTGLEPGTTYYYRVTTKSSDGLHLRAASNTNSFTTAPLIDANQPISFVVAHCFDPYHTAYPSEPQYADLGLKIFASMLSTPPPDFIILQGDTTYYDGGLDYAPNLGTINDNRYLPRWLYWPAQYQFVNLMTFFNQIPGYWQVDDHDYWSNNANAYNPDGWLIFRNVNPTPGDYSTVGENDADYYTSNPYLTSGGDGNEYWRSIRWGQHLEIFLEEGRNLRDYDAGLIWGVEQREWLEQRIRESDATFKIISATTPMIGPVIPDSAYPSVIPDKHANDHFRIETELFLNNIRDVENVFLVAGDRHYKYHSVINSAKYPELSHFHEFGSGAGAAPPHAISGGVPDSDLAVMIYSDADLSASAGYLRVEVVPIEDGAQITFQLIRVTESLDNDVVHEQTFTVYFDEPTPMNIYLPLITK